jgi:hypothetical protein
MATPSALSSSKLDIIHAYRRLLRGALQAVQYSSPARFVVRDQVRAAFREAPSSSSSSSARGFDAGVAKRTAWFLEAAARDRGVEHRVVKNLVRVRLARERAVKRWRVVLTEDKHKYVSLVSCFHSSLADCMEALHEPPSKPAMLLRVE